MTYASICHSFCRFFCILAVSETIVVLVTADFPVVDLERLLAAREVLLSDEGCLVGSDLGEVTFTLLHHRGYGAETQTCCCFIRRDRSGAIVRVLLADVQARAVRVLGGCFTVSTNEVRSAYMTVSNGRFGKTTLSVVNTGCINDFCHSRSAFADQPSAISHQLSASTPWEGLRFRFNG